MRAIRPLVAIATFIALCVALAPASASNADPCAGPPNAVVAENCRAGTPWSTWNVWPGSEALQGFATPFSVDQGQRIDFKVDTTAATYRVDIYRLGWYGGNGARLVTTLPARGGLDQADCPEQPGTGLISCAGWAVTNSWNVPATQASGVYIAHLVSGDQTLENHIPFVVRDDDGHADVLFQTSDTTWQAYNRYGGKSLYTPTLDERAKKVSYDRPFTTREYAQEDFLFNAEFPMIRWLERNGYDVSYTSGADTDARGAELLEHKAFLSVGHDEYWSGAQRANVEAARDAGVNLAFFSGNEVFWKTRWEDGHRTLVTYKETLDDAHTDPSGTWTGTWRDPRAFNPEGGRPENALTGTIFRVNAGTEDLKVPAADGRMRLWRNTPVAAQAPGQTATLGAGTIGYEWDADEDNGARPAGLVRMSTTDGGSQILTDYGATYEGGTATHHLTLDRDTNGTARDALVFGAGTVQWAWGLDDLHDRDAAAVSQPMQQATVNQLADMGAQPATLAVDLQPASPSTDRTPAVAALAGPATVAVTAGRPATIAGTAADAGGGRVGAVEVSVDGGASWHPADGRESWTYTWTPPASGPVAPLVRAADDSGNLTGDVPDAPPGGAGPSGGAPRPRAAVRKLRLGPRRVRMRRGGRVTLRLTCPSGSAPCRARVVLRKGRRVVAAARRTVPAGATRPVRLTLKRATRAAIRRKGSLRLTAVAKVRRGSKHMTIRARVRVLAR